MTPFDYPASRTLPARSKRLRGLPIVPALASRRVYVPLCLLSQAGAVGPRRGRLRPRSFPSSGEVCWERCEQLRQSALLLPHVQFAQGRQRVARPVLRLDGRPSPRSPRRFSRSAIGRRGTDYPDSWLELREVQGVPVDMDSQRAACACPRSRALSPLDVFSRGSSRSFAGAAARGQLAAGRRGFKLLRAAAARRAY